ncbi:uncharacterized protein LOC135494790 isoform X2 [Lineus longissimus]
MDQMSRNIRNNANEICKRVNTVDVLRLMGDKLQEADAEEIRALKERKGNVVAMDKLLEFLPRRRGALRCFVEVLRHEDFNGDYDYIADEIEGISPPGSRSNRPTNRSNQQPASLAFPLQVSTPDQFNQDTNDGKTVEGTRLPGQFETQSYQLKSDGEPYTVARGQTANIQSTVHVAGDPQVLSTVSSTSSVGISDLQRGGKIPATSQKETSTAASPCAYCNGHESCSFFEKHTNGNS